RMKYILMLTATRAEFDWYAKWSPQDFARQAAFMQAFHKELKDSGVLVAAGPGLPGRSPGRSRGCRRIADCDKRHRPRDQRRGALCDGRRLPGIQGVSGRLHDH